MAKNKPRWTYEIVDQEKLDRYFVGKKPSIKALFLIGIEHNVISYGVKGEAPPYASLLRHSQRLQKKGIITKTLRRKTEAQIDRDNTVRKERYMRKFIREQIRTMPQKTLCLVVDLLTTEAYKNRRLELALTALDNLKGATNMEDKMRTRGTIKRNLHELTTPQLSSVLDFIHFITNKEVNEE